MSACKHCKRCKSGCDFCSCCGRCQRCDAVKPAVHPLPYVPVPYPVYPEPPWGVTPWWGQTTDRITFGDTTGTFADMSASFCAIGCADDGSAS